jgi:hypothetical protein
MSAQILGKGRTLAMRRLVLAAIGVSFFVLSGTTFGADVGIANPSAAAAALGGRHATVHPTEPPASNAKTTSTFVDGLYKELRCVTAQLPPKNLGSPRQPAWARRKPNALSPLDGTGGLAAARCRTASSGRARR